jgi:hypothetical protein
MKMSVFWDIGPFSLVETGRRFRGAYYLHHHELIALMLEAESTPEASANFSKTT